MREGQATRPQQQQHLLRERRRLGEAAAAAASSTQRAPAPAPEQGLRAASSDEPRDRWGVRPGKGGVFMMYDDSDGKYPIIARQQRDLDDIGCCNAAIAALPGWHPRISFEGGVYQQRR